MPELPEVETLTRELRKKIVGLVLSECTVREEAILGTPAIRMKKNLPSRKFLKVSRFGKFLCFELDLGFRLWVHLGMTGQLLWKNPSDIPTAHDHLLLYFKNQDQVLWFRDIRKFGEVLLTEAGHLPHGLQKLGPDPLAITAEVFTRLFKKRTGPIKNLLLNQHILAGLGNIYANESLYRAGIHPNRKPKRLSRLLMAKLHHEIREVLIEAIRQGGSSIDDYVHTDGAKGGFQQRHRVYGRSGKGCFECGSAIKKIVLAGRSSFYCPTCQR